MNDTPTKKTSKNAPTFANHVGATARRRLKARRNASKGVWRGLGMMGIVGWSVAIPMLLGVALGAWLDKRHPGSHSWTLALLVGGLVIGCANAAHWVVKEDKAMRDEQHDDEE